MVNSAPFEETPRSLSQLLIDLRESLTEETVRVGMILEAFHERGFGFFLFILGMPTAIPIPAMGLHSVISIPMLLLTLQQAFGCHTIWMPDIIKRQSLKTETVVKMIDHCIPWAQKLEKIAKPRLAFMTRGCCSHLIGVLGFIMVVCIAIPLPLTNTVPAIGIILMSAGVLVRDGLAVIIGAVVGTVWSLAWFIGFFYLGGKGIDMLKNAATSLF